MFKITGLLLISALLLVSSCTEEAITPECNTPATLRDLSGVDGCGFVFELEDGTRLDPIRMGYCGTMLSPEMIEDPLYDFELANGKKVKISYSVSTDMSTACMAGTPVKITCITDISAGETAL